MRLGRRTMLAGAAATFARSGQAEERALVIAQTADAATLDPAFSVDTGTGNVLRHIYETVLTRNGDGSIGAGAALRAESLSATEWRVVLAPGSAFAHGEEVDAEAVRFSLQADL